VQQRTAEVIVAEIGADISVFPSAGHLASWAGLCPGNDESAGKRRSGHARKGSRWLSIALTEACGVPKLGSHLGIMAICRGNRVPRRYTDDAEKPRG